VRLPVLQRVADVSSLIASRNGWTSTKCLGAPGIYCSVIAAIIAGDDWSAVRCM
jgi:hypothetical protein